MWALAIASVSAVRSWPSGRYEDRVGSVATARSTVREPGGLPVVWASVLGCMLVMDDVNEVMNEPVDQPEVDAAPLIPAEPAPPISSRFLFVDVAALRAKQLRRGARVRFEAEQATAPRAAAAE